MTFTISFTAYIIVVPLFAIWLLFWAVVAIVGTFLPKKQILINLDEVKSKDTICKVLNNKKLLSDKEYSFETNDVAAQYDELTFHGYLFVLNPIIFLLKYTSFMDRFVLYLVYKWMGIHYFKKENKQRPKTFFSGLAKVCVSLAGSVGQILYRLKVLDI